jgi:DNA-binding IscR family transcriptional regulator
LVHTQRGIGGGVTLTCEPKDLALYAICEALDDPILHQRCMLGTEECSDDRACPAHEFWKPHRLQTVQFLKDTSVADIAAFESKRRWHS